MSSPLVTRAQAGIADMAISSSVNPTEGVTFHHGGGPLGGFPWLHARCASIWRAWDAYHRAKTWNGIGYNMGACIHGFMFVGRGRGARSAANGTNDGNYRSYAVVYMAGLGEPLTDEGKQALFDAREYLRDGPRPASEATHDHDDWKNTGCPGDLIRAWRAAGMPHGLVWAPPPQPRLSAPVTAIAHTPSGRGYMLVAEDGGVFCFGDAMFFGSLPGIGVRPNAPIVDAAISPSGGGYLLVGADGGAYTFGDFPFAGSLGGMTLNRPIASVDRTPTGAGYWMGGEDGGVFSFGDAPFLGAAA